MRSNSKRQKLYGELNGRPGTSFGGKFEDRLTSLPCCLKTKILSCLCTKEAVKTCVLSKKWQRSWTSVTNLDFEDTLFKSCDDGVLSTHDFISSVNQVLLLHDRSCLQRFSMKCSEYYRESVINSWIAVALLCKVKELDLSVKVNGPHLLPSDVFRCRTLVALDLCISCQVNIPASVCLPILRTLRLYKVQLSSDMSIVNILSGCPVLEDLQLKRCIGNDMHVINIVSSSLTSLTMHSLPYGKYGRYKIIIDTPALKYFNIIGYEAHGYLIKDLNHLIKADIDIGSGNTEPFTGISQVQNLILSNATMEAFYFSHLVLPTFHKLKNMELDTKFHDHPAYSVAWSCLLILLGKSPCLETLDLVLPSMYETYSDDVVPPCFLSHLKVIKISRFVADEAEMEMVKYLLENGKVLEKMTIEYSSYIEEDDKMDLEGLLMMPRSSPVCKIEVL